MPSSYAHDDDGRRVTFDEALWTELTAVRPEFCARQSFTPSHFQRPESDGAEEPHESKVRELYRMIGGLETSDPAKPEPGLSALCLSGGGIRSATFNLGVLQALARSGMLGRFDYLSSVSGGGYIASWLQAWVHRKGLEAAVRELGDDRPNVNPLNPEPVPVDHLREFSNYLTPQIGLFSGDTWTAAAIVLRNLLLNWMVIIPLLAALVAIPQGLYLIVQSTIAPELGATLLRAALFVELLASLSVFYHRRFVREPRHPSKQYVAFCVAPIVAAGALLTAAALGYQGMFAPLARGERLGVDARQAITMFAVLWCVVVPTFGWLFVEVLRWFKPPREVRNAVDARAVDSQRNYRRALWFEFPALIGSGAVAAVLLVAMIKAWYSGLYARPALYVMLVLPALLGLYLLARTLFVGAASLSEGSARTASPGLMNDADREWWARLSGWILFISVAWVAVTAVCLFGQYLLEAATGFAEAAIAAAGGLSGALAAFLGSRDKTSTASVGPSLMQRIALLAAAPVFIVCVFVMTSWGTALIGGPMVRSEEIFFFPLKRQSDLINMELLEFWAIPVVSIALALAMGCIVNVNRFSLHGLYRNRLVRAYLGASNEERAADPFTGFDQNDNLRMYRLKPGKGPQRLLPIVNLTLNLLRDGKLAWQQRKAESFSMTPYFCGNFHEGYRRSQMLRRPGRGDARHGGYDLRRSGEPAYGLLLLAGARVRDVAVQRAARRLARQYEQQRRPHVLAARSATGVVAAARRDVWRHDEGLQVHQSLGRRTLRQPRPVRSGAASLPLCRRERCGLRRRQQVRRSGRRDPQDPHRLRRADSFRERNRDPPEQ